jgi:L-amino acid N-acyltransferase YncA
MIRKATVEDAEAICTIYNHYIENTTISFEEHPVSVKEMQDRIIKITNSLPWLISENKERITGYAYADTWMIRSAYRYTVVSAIYLDPKFLRQGIGSRLYQRLLSDLRQHSLHSVIGIIALPNPASIGLHEKLGFEKVAHFKQVGRKFGKWIDVGYWERIL